MIGRKWTTAPSVYCDGCGQKFEDPEYPRSRVDACCPNCKTQLHCVAVELLLESGLPNGVTWTWELAST